MSTEQLSRDEELRRRTVLSVAEAAYLARVGQEFIRDEAKSGRLPSFRAGRVIRIPLAGLLHYIGEQ